MRARTKVTLAAITVVAFAGYGKGHAATLPARPGHATVTAASESGALSCSQLEALWRKAGGSPAAAFTAAEIARAESAGREYATNANTDGSTDYGYWQINNYAHPGMATFDPLGNARSAVAISSDGTNWFPWVTWRHGAETGQC